MAALLMACEGEQGTANTRGSGEAPAAAALREDAPGDLLTGQEKQLARGVPQFAQVEFRLTGIQTPLYGVVHLVVGEGDERYVLSASSRDQSLTLSGAVHLSGDMAPVRGREGVRTRFSGQGDFDWIYDNRGTVTLSGERDGVAFQQEYVLRSGDLRAEKSGLLMLELQGVELSRIDTVKRQIAPGTDFTLKAMGRLSGGCEKRLRANEKASPMASDPKHQNPRCQSLLEGL
jgi:hypothetical protein